MSRNATSNQTVKVSKPQLLPSNLHRSSSASHEFSSDYASDLSSPVSQTGYETPPSRISTPHNQPNNGHNMILPQRPTLTVPATYTIRHGDGQSPAVPVQPLERLDNLSPPTPGHDDTPYIRFALEQITLREELGLGRASVPEDNFDTLRTIQAEDLLGPPGPVQPADQVYNPPVPSPGESKRRGTDQALTPVHHPDGEQWANLGYVPLPLRPLMLALLVVMCLLMIAGLVFSNVYTIRNYGLYDYDGNATPRYFIFQYLPQTLGALILLCLFVVQTAIYRVLPYFCMSQELERVYLLQDMPILPANFVFPDLRFYRLGEPLIGLVLLIFWLMNFTVPLLSCLYQTQYYVEIEPNRWRWSTVQGLGWFLVAWYCLLIAALLYCMIRFRKRNSALMWDPSSIADVVLLYQRSNILADFARSEVEPDLRDFLPPRYLRLGFWTSSGSHDVYHTVGQAHLPLNRLSLQGEQIRLPVTRYQSESSESFDIERHRYSGGSDFTRNIHSPYLRFRWCPWFLRDSSLLAWIIAALLLLTAFLVVSFVNRAVQTGFDPLLPSATQPNGFSPSNFLYSFLPAFLATWLFLFWQPIETYFKAIQPYANLASPQGTTARRSLLQSYTAMPPLMVTIQAVINKDFKLAYVTFISLLSITIPILAGGVFTAQLFSTGEVRIVASMPGYVAMCVFLSIYSFSYLIVWPTRKRYLPHAVNTIAGQLSFLYASPLLNDPAIRNVKTRAELVTRLNGDGHLAPNDIDEKGLTGDGRKKIRDRRNKLIDREPKYAFGIYVGRDGKEHLGIDRLQRPGSAEMLVTTGDLRPSRSFRSTKT